MDFIIKTVVYQFTFGRLSKNSDNLFLSILNMKVYS